jgi:hypothetical protein
LPLLLPLLLPEAPNSSRSCSFVRLRVFILIRTKIRTKVALHGQKQRLPLCPQRPSKGPLLVSWPMRPRQKLSGYDFLFLFEHLPLAFATLASCASPCASPFALSSKQQQKLQLCPARVFILIRTQIRTKVAVAKPKAQVELQTKVNFATFVLIFTFASPFAFAVA